jgi:DNA-binding IclR family transcriptional regulator
MTRRLGYREEQVLAAIRAAADVGDWPPYRAICEATGLGTHSEVRRIIVRLERRGILKRAPNAHRIGIGIVRLA